jgi:hypothetical protein
MLEWVLLAFALLQLCSCGLRRMALSQSRALRQDTVPLLASISV